MRSTASVLLRLSPAVDALLLAGTITVLAYPQVAGEPLAFFFELLTLPAWLLLLGFFGLYESQRIEGLSGIARTVLSAHGVAFVTLVPLTWTIVPFSAVPGVIAILAAGCTVILVEKWAAYGILQFVRSHGYDVRNVCVIGTADDAHELAARFRRSPSWGFRVACVGVETPAGRQFQRYPSGDLLADSLPAVLRTEVIDEVLLTVPPQQLDAERATIGVCREHGVFTRFLWQTAEAGEHGMALREHSKFLQEVCGEPVVTLGGPKHDDHLIFLKRLFDIAASSMSLVLLLPLFATIAMLVKVSSSGPVIFRQRRTGLNGREFTLYKFRTMVDGAETLLSLVAPRNVMKGPIFKDPEDIRITQIGRVLRRFSLDELPQLWNVLKGDMSLVGPRPLPVHESATIAGIHRRRFTMRPGITCLWQVNGRSTCDYATWMQYDLQYVDGWSLVLDAKLLLKTVPVVLTGRGAC
jgi:exopolysaccharide biosynthesis polyprenyl glycosylphosphotransferase